MSDDTSDTVEQLEQHLLEAGFLEQIQDWIPAQLRRILDMDQEDEVVNELQKKRESDPKAVEDPLNELQQKCESDRKAVEDPPRTPRRSRNDSPPRSNVQKFPVVKQDFKEKESHKRIKLRCLGPAYEGFLKGSEIVAMGRWHMPQA